MGIFKPLPPRLRRGHPLALGLIGAWEFTEGSGLSAYDSSGYGNHGTLTNGPLWVGGQAGAALQFDGTNDVVTLPGKPIVAVNGQFSVCGRIFPNSQVSYGHFVGESGSRGIFYTSSGAIDFYYASSHLSTLLLTNQAWNSYVGSYDGAAITHYVNGKFSNTSSLSLSSGMTFNVIGADNTSGSEVFKGSLDDVRIYSRPLSAQDATMYHTET